MADAVAATPEPPYYAVIFTTRRAAAARSPEYEALAARMIELAAGQPGFLGVESAGDVAAGITVSYWAGLADIERWKADAEHRAAQRAGQTRFYEEYSVRVARVERDYRFAQGDTPVRA